MENNFFVYSLLIFLGVALAFIFISLAFLAISSHKSFEEIKSTSIWMLISSFLLITFELMLSVNEHSLQFLPTPSVKAQSVIFICLLTNCVLLLCCFFKYHNDSKYTSFNESVLILGIMQVTFCMSITSAFQNSIFILQIAANAIYLLLPALAIYEFSKISSTQKKIFTESSEKKKDKDSQ